MATVVMHRLSIRATDTGQDGGFWWISNETPPATIRAALQTLKDYQTAEPAAGWQAFMDGRPADVETLAVLAKMAQPEPVYQDGAEQQPTNPPAPGPQNVRGPLGVLEIRAALLADGFTHYETRAGLRPLELFDPYGMAPPTDTTPAGVNWGPKWTPYEGAIVTEANGQTVIRDWPGKDFTPPLMLGGFPVSRQTKTEPEPQPQYFSADCGRNDFYISDGKMIEGPNERHAYQLAQRIANITNEGVRVMNPPHSAELVITNDPDAPGHELAIVDPDEPNELQEAR